MALMAGIADSFRGKRVLLTGHTGFKGSWLSLWLGRLGAEVYGLALEPPTSPSMFDLCRVADTLDHRIGDIRDYAVVRDRVAEVQPDVVLHLAAQPIVRQSYVEPLETMATNVMGTAHVLEAVRAWGRPCTVVVVSSDKCYDNRGWVWGYRENDAMGGSDPYSASKGATELVTSSWRDSYFGPESGVRLASARAGNVIGGGDWAADRIVPDCIRAFCDGQAVALRNPAATRPWQHVLEPLGGYLLLAARLMGDDAQHYTSGWNFGPAPHDVRPVGDLVRMIASHWPETAEWTGSPGPHPKEAAVLSLNIDKAATQMGWRPTWDLETMIGHTARWFREWHCGAADMRAVTLEQIALFEADSVRVSG